MGVQPAGEAVAAEEAAGAGETSWRRQCYLTIAPLLSFSFRFVTPPGQECPGFSFDAIPTSYPCPFACCCCRSIRVPMYVGTGECNAWGES